MTTFPLTLAICLISFCGRSCLENQQAASLPLPDPEKLLQGSGGQTRWIHVEGACTLARPAVASLIDEAIARNRVPFASAGRGSVVIRSTSAKQRRQPRA